MKYLAISFFIVITVCNIGATNELLQSQSEIDSVIQLLLLHGMELQGARQQALSSGADRIGREEVIIAGLYLDLEHHIWQSIISLRFFSYSLSCLADSAHGADCFCDMALYSAIALTTLKGKFKESPDDDFSPIYSEKIKSCHELIEKGMSWVQAITALYCEEYKEEER